MKVLTAARMREVDRRTIESGIPGLILMENAGHRVLELMQEVFAPLADRRIVVLCGKGNNGGDGFVVARQLYTRIRPRALDVVLSGPPEELKGDAAENYRMLRACGCPVAFEVTPEMRHADVVVDALLGTGLRGPATGRLLDLIHEINTGFPLARIVAVDIPSGIESDRPDSAGEIARADYTVTFTAPKIGHVLPPNCDRIGRLRIGAIGSPPTLYEDDPANWLSLTEPAALARLFAPRPAGAHKGHFGHVLVVGGSRGKTGAAVMAGLAALRAGAGLVTVASAASAIPVIAAHAPELMTEPLDETGDGAISFHAIESGRWHEILARKDVVAIGPGIGTHPETVAFVNRIFEDCKLPVVLDADALNALAGIGFRAGGRRRVLTPHPGEMSRLTGRSTAKIQADRLEVVRAFAMDRGVTVVLKGQRSLIATPDGQVRVNPSGTPAMATGGTGDILTGLIAGLLGQFPDAPELAVSGAVWLHGRAGELGAADLGEQCLIATDLLKYLPAAMRETLSA
ncbi:MAG: NAD(P)H-hydrate dehydratase [Bryobacteraceae bacterium]